MITLRSTAQRPSRRLVTALVVGGALCMTLLTAAPAFAATPAATSQSCWEDVDTGDTGCFDTGLDAHEQIEIATGVPLVALETGKELSDRYSGSAQRAAAVDYLLVTGYDGINKTGDSKSYFTSNAKICTAGTSYGFQNLLTWSDRFESIQSFNGCHATLFMDINFGGAFTDPIATSDDLGTFKNTASSLGVD